MRRSVVGWLVGLALFVTPLQSFATTITADMTVDDAFVAYISTNDSVAGTQFCTGNAWQTTYTCAAALTPGVTNYIHVAASDVAGVISAFIGDFTLSDGLFRFANGTQLLRTNTSNWTVRLGSFAGANLTPTTYGSNGVAPWGTRPLIDASAQWIWEQSGNNCNQCTRYFSAEIIALPEPASLTLMGAGLAGLALRMRRRLSNRRQN